MWRQAATKQPKKERRCQWQRHAKLEHKATTGERAGQTVLKVITDRPSNNRNEPTSNMRTNLHTYRHDHIPQHRMTPTVRPGLHTPVYGHNDQQQFVKAIMNTQTCRYRIATKVRNQRESDDTKTNGQRNKETMSWESGRGGGRSKLITVLLSLSKSSISIKEAAETSNKVAKRIASQTYRDQ